jgi:hypothetical protein
MAHFVATPFNEGAVYSAAKLAFDLGCAGFSADSPTLKGKPHPSVTMWRRKLL